MHTIRYRRSGKERRRFNLGITFQDRRSGYDRRRIRDRRAGFDRRDPKGPRGWFPLGRRHASGEMTVIPLPERTVPHTPETYQSRYSDVNLRYIQMK